MESGLFASIVADWGGPAEYIADGTGLRIDLQSPARFLDDMAAAIVRLAGDTALRADAGAAARARVAARYDWDVLVDELLELYAEVSSVVPPA